MDKCYVNVYLTVQFLLCTDTTSRVIVLVYISTQLVLL